MKLRYLYTIAALILCTFVLSLSKPVYADSRPSARADIAALAASLAPSYYRTSAFMFGKVAVGIVTPQCIGTFEPCSETWNQAALDQVTAQVKNAMAWWTNRMNGLVTFVYDEHRQAPTGYEPIRHSMMDSRLWISDTMTRMGFSGSTIAYTEQVYAYDNWMRARYGTDWAFTIFVADSLNNASGLFSDGTAARSGAWAPFMVTPYGGPYWTGAYLAATIAHETGHVFGALDEYASAGIGCAVSSGYLSVQNQNSELGCTSNVPSIMRSLSAYFSNQVDSFALAMVGYRVSSGILPDPINTKPLLQLDPIPSTGANPTITGVAQDQPFNPPSGPAMTINYITAVQYRVDGQAWQNAAPLGAAAFNQVAEGFTFTPALTNGTHTVEVRATNRVNNASDIVRAVVTVQGGSPQPTTVPPTSTPLPPVPTATPNPPTPIPTRTSPLPTNTPISTVPPPTSVPTIPAPGGTLTIKINAGKNALSLPYSAHTGASLIAAINAQGGSATEVDSWTGTTWAVYKAGGSGDFSIDPGAGYIVKANSPSTWIVPLSAGSSVQAIKITSGWDMLGTLACKNGASSCYTASTLAAEINAQGGGVAEIDRMVNGIWSPYFVGYSSADFPIVAGQGYFVRSIRSVSWTPQK